MKHLTVVIVQWCGEQYTFINPFDVSASWTTLCVTTDDAHGDRPYHMHRFHRPYQLEIQPVIHARERHHS